jgi:uncharacterized protein (TIRG00374 family)
MVNGEAGTGPDNTGPDKTGPDDAGPDNTGSAARGERWPAWTRRPWARRLVKPARRGVLLFILALVVEYLVVPELVGASRDLSLLGQVSAWWVTLGVLLEGLSLYCYAVLTKVLLPPGPKPRLWRLFLIDLSAAAVAHVIPAGTLGTAALGFKLFTSEGISGNDATVMMAAKGIGSTVVLNVLLWLSLVISIPLAGFQPIYGTVAIIGTIVLAGVAVLVVGIIRGGGFASRMLRMAGDRLPFVNGEQIERAVLDASHSFALLARDRRVMAWSLLWASLNWILDAASLWCFVAAFGHFANPVELFAAYGIANVAGALPLTPGGLGVVDSITPLLLVGFGVTRSVATLGVLSWRVVNFWLPIPTGAIAFALLKMKPVSGWSNLQAAFTGMLATATGKTRGDDTDLDSTAESSAGDDAG